MLLLSNCVLFQQLRCNCPQLMAGAVLWQNAIVLPQRPTEQAARRFDPEGDHSRRTVDRAARLKPKGKTNSTFIEHESLPPRRRRRRPTAGWIPRRVQQQADRLHHISTRLLQRVFALPSSEAH